MKDLRSQLVLDAREIRSPYRCLLALRHTALAIERYLRHQEQLTGFWHVGLLLIDDPEERAAVRLELEQLRALSGRVAEIVDTFIEGSGLVSDAPTVTIQAD